MNRPTSPDLPLYGFGTGELRGVVAHNAVAAALRSGYRLIDTGAIYGNEHEVGLAIAESDVPREDILVMTKGMHDEHEHGYEATWAAFQASLSRLALQYVDYYLVHWPSNKVLRQDTWRAMEDIQFAQKARFVGVANYALHHLEELQTARVQPAVNQIEFHPYVFAEQKHILEYCRERDIAVIGYSTFAGGQADDDPAVGAIARHHHKTPRQILTRWSMQHGVVPLIRSSRPEHILENRDVEDFVLTGNEMDILNNMHGTRLFPDPAAIP